MSPLARRGVALLGVLVLAAGGPGCGLPATSRDDGTCAGFAPTIAGLLRPVPVAKFAGIDTSWTLPEVFARLGAARRRLPSGPYDYDWIGEDGSLFEVSSATECGVVTRAGFVAGRH